MIVTVGPVGPDGTLVTPVISNGLETDTLLLTGAPIAPTKSKKNLIAYFKFFQSTYDYVKLNKG